MTRLQQRVLMDALQQYIDNSAELTREVLAAEQMLEEHLERYVPEWEGTPTPIPRRMDWWELINS